MITMRALLFLHGFFLFLLQSLLTLAGGTDTCHSSGQCRPFGVSGTTGGTTGSKVEAATEAWCYAACVQQNIQAVSQV